MAIVYATKSGNWTDTTVWNTGVLPTTADDVYSNTFTVTINTSPTVLSIRNGSATGVTLGGSFVLTSEIILTCTGNGLVCSTGSSLITSTLASGSSCTINSKITQQTSLSSCLIHSGAGTVIVAGDIFSTGGAGNFVIAINNSGSGTLIISGNITGPVSANAGFATVSNSGVMTITGDITGGNNISNSGVSNGGTLTVSGNIKGGSGGYGLSNAGTATVTASVVGGGSASAYNNTGTLTHIGLAQASATYPAIGPGSATQVTILTGPLLCSSPNDATAGVNPCIALRWFPADTTLSTFRYEMRGATASGSPSVRPARQLFLTDAYSSGYPASNNVNNGSTYGPGAIYTGTMNIPNSSAVSLGVPVGTTTGTMVLPTLQSIWNYSISDITTSGSIGERLKNTATVETVNTILSNGLR